MTGLRGGKNPKRKQSWNPTHRKVLFKVRDEWGTRSCGIPLLRTERARMGHPRDRLAQESGRLGPCQRAPPVTSFSADLPKLLAQGQALPLIRRSDADAVDLFRRLQQSHV